MKFRFISIIPIFLTIPFTAAAQNQKIFLFETGASFDKSLSGNIKYVSKWDDSLSAEAGLLYFYPDFTEKKSGLIGLTGRLTYKLDMLSVIPSFYVGLGTGFNIDDSASNFVMFEYGVAADYMYSRKIYFGLGFTGYTYTENNSTETDGNNIKTSSSFLINFRLTWITGEEW